MTKSNCISASSVPARLKTVGSPDTMRPTDKLRVSKDNKANTKNGPAPSQPNLRYLILSFVAFIAFDSMVSWRDIGLVIKLVFP